MSEGAVSRPVWVLIAVAVVAAGVFGWRALRGGPALVMKVTQGPQGVMFLLDGRVGVMSLRVTADPDGQTDGPKVVWHLELREDEDGNVREPAERMVVNYGDRWQMGLRPAEGAPRRAEALLPGVLYEAVADTTAGRAEARFTLPEG